MALTFRIPNECLYEWNMFSSTKFNIYTIIVAIAPTPFRGIYRCQCWPPPPSSFPSTVAVLCLCVCCHPFRTGNFPIFHHVSRVKSQANRSVVSSHNTFARFAFLRPDCACVCLRWIQTFKSCHSHCVCCV